MGSGTGKYVVVFDQIGVATGEAVTFPGQPPVATSTDHFRGETVELDDATAERHLASGAVIKASDKRAKNIQPNPILAQGVKREVLDPVLLDEVEPVTAGEPGATRTTGTGLGSVTQLRKKTVPELKALAAEYGVEVTSSDNKRTLAKKLSEVSAGAAAGETRNPGQGDDQSPPPPPGTQPDEKPE